MTGNRFNEGKRKWGLLSWVGLEELVKVLEFGAKKYDSWNWSKGLSFTETFECLQRHAVAWYNGEDKDPETGLSHMAHVLCNAMFLMHFIVTGTGKDDRYFKKNDNNKDKEVASIDQERARQEFSRSFWEQRNNPAYGIHPPFKHALEQRGLPNGEENLRAQEGPY